MKKNNKFFIKYKIYIIIGTLFVVWASFVFFIIIPSVKLLKSNFDAVQMKLLDQKVSNEKIDKISNLKEDFTKVEAEKNNLEVIFSKNNIVELAKELETIAQQTGNTITISVDEDNKALVEVGKARAGEKPEENKFLTSLPTKNYLTIKLKLSGNYNSLIEFIDKLNSLKYYNSVASFKLMAEKVVIENENVNDKPGGGISVMNGNMDTTNLSDLEKEKLVLSSDLNVIFYSLETNDAKK